MQIFGIGAQGANNGGQLGHGTKCDECVKPTEVPLNPPPLELENVDTIVAGACHSFILSKTGIVYGCGSNDRGQLDDSREDTHFFRVLPCLSNKKIKQLATKWDSSYAVTSENLCLAWGPNQFGQLGHTIKKDSIHPPYMVSSNVKQVAAGLRHVLFLNCDGSVSSSGDGKRGQLGRRSTTDQEKIAGLEGIVQIACGQNHNLVLTDSGKVLGWGCNKFRQLAAEGSDIVSEPILVCEVDSTKCKLLCGWTHSAVMDDKGRLINWGRNKYGQLGVSPSPFQNRPQELKFKPFKDVEFGSEHSIAITIDGELVCWGWNEHGNCGSGDKADVITPTLVDAKGTAVKIAAGAGQSFAITCVEPK